MSDSAADRVRELLEHVSEALGARRRRSRSSRRTARSAPPWTATTSGCSSAATAQTIDAVQHLAYQDRRARRPTTAGMRVIVDAAGYRERREQALQRQADEAAEDAVRTGRPVALDAMSATERKVVHEYLKDRERRRDVLRGHRARPPPRRGPARLTP